jgi:predicted  nucleic acid-binding Zn-ribbon protein
MEVKELKETLLEVLKSMTESVEELEDTLYSGEKFYDALEELKKEGEITPDEYSRMEEELVEFHDAIHDPLKKIKKEYKEFKDWMEYVIRITLKE